MIKGNSDTGSGGCSFNQVILLDIIDTQLLVPGSGGCSFNEPPPLWCGYTYMSVLL